MTDRLMRMLDELARGDQLDAADRADFVGRAASLCDASDEQVDRLLDTLLQRDPPSPDRTVQAMLAAVLAPLAQRGHRDHPAGRTDLPPARIEKIAALYGHLGPETAARSHLLCMLTALGGPAGLSRFAQLITADPPQESTAAALPFVPLFHRSD